MPEGKKNSEGTPEVDRPVRVDEVHKHLLAMIPLNAKRTYDELQQESLETIRQCRQERADLHVIITQTLANMSENANMCTKQALTNSDLINKQCIRHNDVAIDCTWDPGPGEESLKNK